MNIKALLNSQLDTSNTYSRLYGYRDSRSLIQRFNLQAKLESHNGCINTICWSDDNYSLILSGSDDQKLCITDAFTGAIKTSVQTGHKTNIFSAKFLPQSNDEKLVSCASGGDIYLTNINYSTSVNNQNHFLCHGDKTCYELRTFVQDPFIFTSCGLDGTCKWFDTRVCSKCDKLFCQEHTLIKLSTGISAIAINPLIPYHLACAGLDGVVRFYDRRMLSVGSDDNNHTSLLKITNNSTKGLFCCFSVVNNSENTGAGNSLNSLFVSNHNSNNSVISNKRITSLQYDRYGNEVLVSYQSDDIYLLDWRDLNEVPTSFSSKTSQTPTSSDEASSSSSSSSSITDSNRNTSSPIRKFRIQTDWSDTGPNSIPFNEMDNTDPRAFLARRLNDWFTGLSGSQYRPRNNSEQQLRSGNSDGSRGSRGRSNEDENDDNEEEENDNENEDDDENNDADDDDELMETENNSSMENARDRSNMTKSPSNNSSNSNSSNTNSSGTSSSSSELRRASLLSITSSLIGSRIRSKQAMRLENNAIKNKPTPKVRMVYTGHRNARTIIKECNFWGNDHIMSGSDCGHVFFWNKHTAKIEHILEADKHVVNCVQENPLYPVLASSGIDYNIKIWMPTLEEPTNSSPKIETITKRNKLMLDESKNTIFIPVQFMLPALRLFGANMNFRNSGSSRISRPNSGTASSTETTSSRGQDFEDENTTTQNNNNNIDTDQS